jgi:hypothetical protein
MATQRHLVRGKAINARYNLPLWLRRRPGKEPGNILGGLPRFLSGATGVLSES